MDLTEDKDFEIGCEPDYNVYTEDLNETISFVDSTRYAGGHIHIGFVNVPKVDVLIKMIKAIDFVLAPFVMEFDKDTERKEIYGTPGRFRPKPYGFEYRSLSNFWLASDTLIGRVYDLVEYAIENYENFCDQIHEMQVKDGFQKTIGVDSNSTERDIIAFALEEVYEL